MTVGPAEQQLEQVLQLVKHEGARQLYPAPHWRRRTEVDPDHERHRVCPSWLAASHSYGGECGGDPLAPELEEPTGQGAKLIEVHPGDGPGHLRGKLNSRGMVRLVPGRGCQTADVYVVHATQALLRRVGLSDTDATANSTTLLGPWYATIAKGRPQVALFVNEATLLPVLLPLVPSATLLRRFPTALAEVLTGHGVDQDVIDRETAAMAGSATSKTNSRSLVGILNEFVFLANHHRQHDAHLDLTELSVSLARTPCGPLYKRHVSPNRELKALLEQTSSLAVVHTAGGDGHRQLMTAVDSLRDQDLLLRAQDLMTKVTDEVLLPPYTAAELDAIHDQ